MSLDKIVFKFFVEFKTINFQTQVLKIETFSIKIFSETVQITFINLEMATNAHALEVFKQGITNYVEAQLLYLDTMTPDGEDQVAVENVNEARKNLGNQALLLLEVNGINVEQLSGKH